MFKIHTGEFPHRTTDVMPKYADIPEDFRRERGESRKWHQFQSDWFFSGLKEIEVTPKPGVDKKQALRHLGFIQQSWDTSHEHKSAAVAWLASEWFEDVKYAVAK